ncbi:uncharacterized protein [Leptinotarsa decemlineata]|uniref:uncharacterized protein n=1 Tax=Leptinotarsa decemlineata TaxID=7539 RepID=UPI003D30B598
MSNVIGTNTNKGRFTSVDGSTQFNTCAQEQEVNDLKEFLKLEQEKYVQYKVIYDTLEEYINEAGGVDDNLRAKVRSIILSESLAQTSILEFNSFDESNISVLGANDTECSNLTYPEGNLLQKKLNLKLIEKHQNLAQEFHKVTNRDLQKSLETRQDSTSLQLSSEDKVQLDYKNKLTIEQELYVKNLISLSELLEKIADLRLKSLPDIIEKKVDECQVEEKINHLKFLLSNVKCRVDVFTETSCSLKAYKDLIKDIQNQQEDYKKQIQQLNELKEKYKQVSCKQYDDILKSYIQYKASIEKKRILYDCLKS